MTRLSDSLHGAADRAPVGDATVSVTAAARKVRSQRLARGAGNAAAGVGALALVAAGVFAPGFAASSGDPNPEAAALPRVPGLDDGKFVSESDAVGTRLADWGYCGSYPLRDWGYGDGTFSAVANWDGGEYEGGSATTVPVTVTSSVEGTFSTSGPAAVILWDGMVVGIINEAGDLAQLDLTNGAALDGEVKVSLTSCFDDEPLPASKYELLVSQAFTEVSDEVVEPEPSIAPTPEVTVVGEDAVVSNEAAVDPEVEVLPPPPVAFAATYRAVAEPIPFSIAGDPVENPFGQYIPEPWTPPAKPDNILTPDLARQLFADNATNGAWDFATGTSRYLLHSYSNNGEDGSNQDFFGCAWEGQSGTFPKRSADLNLLGVKVDAPSRIGVSYGWVVDENPQIAVSVTNTSQYALPGFYGQPTRNLYLVKDGKVVAEAWPTDIDRYGEVGILESDARAAEGGGASVSVLPETENYWGVLEAGDSLSGNYLWREINGCWTDSGPATVTPGTYTLLVAQTIYIENGGGYPVTYGPVDDLDAATKSSSGGTDGDAPSGVAEPAIAVGEPVPGSDPESEYQWAELQAWFSVGTVTVS